MGSRDALLARLAAVLEEGTAGRAQVSVISGDAGIGKTWLCQAFAARADAVGCTVLRTQGLEAESAIPHAGLHDVLSPLLDTLSSLPAPRAAAIRAALRLADADLAPDPLAIAAGCLAMVTTAAQRRPVCIVVDDAHWLDPETLSALTFAARRLVLDRVVVLFSTRPGRAPALTAGGFPVIEVGGLAEEECGVLIEQVDGTEPAAFVVKELHAATGGNPLALHEALRALTPDQLAGRAALPSVLPTPASIQQVYAHRLGHLPADARQAVLVLAAEEAAPMPVVLRALDELGVGSAALGPAEAEGFVHVAGDRFRFSHPLARAAAYHAAGPEDRRCAHRALAAAWQPGHDSYALAWHLADATTGVDRQAADELARVADIERRHGAHHAAAQAYRRAAQHEPDPARRAVWLVHAAQELAASPAGGDFLGLLEEARRLGVDGPMRADVAMLRGRALAAGGELMRAADVFASAAREVRLIDPARAIDLFFEAAMVRVNDGDVLGGLHFTSELLAVGTEAGGALQRTAEWLAAPALVLTGDFARGDRFARSMFDQADHLVGRPLFNAAHCARWLEELEVGHRLVDRGMAEADRHGTLSFLPTMLAVRADLYWAAGRILEAGATAAEGARLGAELGQAAPHGYALSMVARARAATNGDVGPEVAEELQRLPVGALAYFRPAVLGMAALARHDLDEAATQFAETARVARAWGTIEPNVFQWQADHIEALIEVGRTAEAEAELTHFSRVAERSGRRWALATAARCRALLAPAAQLDEAFAAALYAHADASPYEVARTQLSWGRRAVEAGRTVHAAPHLRRALDAFDRLGARVWADQADALLRRSGGTGAPARRRPGLGELSEQERQVAMLATEGLTNKEIAARLIVSEKTVEFHLGKVYRKLGVQRRSQLQRALL